jgi:hypothetical protein
MIAGPRIDLTVWACHSYPVSSVAMFVRQYTKTLRLFVSAIHDLKTALGKSGLPLRLILIISLASNCP